MTRLTSLAAIALLTVPTFVLMSPCRADGILDTNLVVNGDAESGPGAPNDTKATSIPGWTFSNNFSVIQYGASGGFPDKTSPGPDDRGNNFFYGGPGTPASAAKQWISLKTGESVINTGAAVYTLSAYLGGYEGQRDNAVVIADFKSGSGAILKHVVLGPVTPTDRKSVTGLVQRSAIGRVPAGSAGVLVKIVTTRYDGGDDDGSADNISLVLHKKS